MCVPCSLCFTMELAILLFIYNHIPSMCAYIQITDQYVDDRDSSLCSETYPSTSSQFSILHFHVLFQDCQFCDASLVFRYIMAQNIKENWILVHKKINRSQLLWWIFEVYNFKWNNLYLSFTSIHVPIKLSGKKINYHVWSIMQLNCIHIHMAFNSVTAPVLLGLLLKFKYMCWEYHTWTDSSNEFSKTNSVILVHV